jgi:anti-sigma B factor antagonist
VTVHASEVLVIASTAHDVAVLEVVGDIDVESCGVVRDEVRSAEERAATVVIDLRRVAFLDSAGLGVIAGAATRAKQEGRRFELLAPSPPVRQVLSLFGLTSLVV